MKSSVVKRSIVIDGKKTSICLEEPFWSGFKEIARGGGLTLSELVSRIKSQQAECGNFSSAIRVYILSHFRHRPTTLAAESARRQPDRPAAQPEVHRSPASAG
jgi:predicted DNA-binding ribbon-helix-helix protein